MKKVKEELYNPDTKTTTKVISYEFRGTKEKSKFRETLKKEVQLVYRATPSDKLKFVAAMKRSGSSCALTGESVTDAESIQEASVGFAMGGIGCAVAQDKADIVILDDNLFSVKNAIKWGRNVFDNCRKFVQYQMTVNIALIGFMLVSSITIGKSPFSVI